MIEFLSISALIMLAVISPGPDFAMVTRNSLYYSRTSGYFTALGIACSTIFHTLYCLFGLAVVISKSLLLFNIVKYIGAAYLIYIGIKGIFSKNTVCENEVQVKSNAISRFQSFSQGFLCNALNPKTILFFLALYTMILKPTTPVFLQVIYGLEIAVIHLVWFLGVALAMTHPQVKLGLNKIQKHIAKVMGGFFVLFGLKIAMLSQR